MEKKGEPKTKGKDKNTAEMENTEKSTGKTIPRLGSRNKESYYNGESSRRLVTTSTTRPAT